MSDESEQAREQDDYCGAILWVAVQFSCHSYQSQKTSGFQKSKQSCCLKWNKNKVLNPPKVLKLKWAAFWHCCAFGQPTDVIYDTSHICTYLWIYGIKAMSRGFSGTKKRQNLPIRLTAIEYVYSIKATRWCKMYSSSFDQIYVIIVCCEDIYGRYCLGTAFKNATMIHSPTICRCCL